MVELPLSPQYGKHLCLPSPPCSLIPGVSERARAAAIESLNGPEPQPALPVVRQPGAAEAMERTGLSGHVDAVQCTPVRPAPGRAGEFPGSFAQGHSARRFGRTRSVPQVQKAERVASPRASHLL